METKVESMLSFSTSPTNKNDWCIDNGCSKHMTDDKNMSLTLKKERDG